MPEPVTVRPTESGVKVDICSTRTPALAEFFTVTCFTDRIGLLGSTLSPCATSEALNDPSPPPSIVTCASRAVPG